MLELVALAALAPLPNSALPHTVQPAEPKISIVLDSDIVTLGKAVSGKVVVTFAPGVHGYPNPPGRDYEIPLEVKSSTRALQLTDVRYPKGKEINFAGSKTLAYEGRIEIPFRAAIKTKMLGKFVGKIEVGYQQCDEQACYPPASQVVPVSVTLTKS